MPQEHTQLFAIYHKRLARGERLLIIDDLAKTVVNEARVEEPVCAVGMDDPHIGILCSVVERVSRAQSQSNWRTKVSVISKAPGEEHAIPDLSSQCISPLTNYIHTSPSNPLLHLFLSRTATTLNIVHLVLARRRLTRLQLIQIPPAHREVPLVLIHALPEVADVRLARLRRLKVLVDGVLATLGLREGLGGLGRGGRGGGAAAEETADGVADGGADCDTTGRGKELVGTVGGDEGVVVWRWGQGLTPRCWPSGRRALSRRLTGPLGRPLEGAAALAPGRVRRWMPDGLARAVGVPRGVVVLRRDAWAPAPNRETGEAC